MLRVIIASQFSKNTRCAPDPLYQRQQHGSDVGNDGQESSDALGRNASVGRQGVRGTAGDAGPRAAFPPWMFK